MSVCEVVTKVFSTNGQYFVVFTSGTRVQVTSSTYSKVKRKLEEGHILSVNVNNNSPYVFTCKQSTDISKASKHYSTPLFEYRDTDFTASSMRSACDKFLDEAWGQQYVDYLENLGLDATCIDAVEDLEEVEDEDYYKSVEKLRNDTLFQIEVWANDEPDSYEGFAQCFCKK